MLTWGLTCTAHPSCVNLGARLVPLTLCPPHLQENETWWLCNCTMAICKYNNTVELVEVKCDPPPMPTCSNGLMPVRVEDPDKCCWHWECDCKPDAAETHPTCSPLCVWGLQTPGCRDGFDG